MNIKKSLGIPLCCVFVPGIVGWLVNKLAMSVLGYNQIGYAIFWLILNLFVCFGLFYAYRRKNILLNNIGTIASIVGIIIYGLFAINNAIHLFSDFNLFGFWGNYSSVILEIIVAFCIAGFLFGSKAWLPIKIVGTLSYVPSIIAGFIIAKLPFAYDLCENTGDYSLINKMSDAIILSDMFVLILSLCALILTIVWIKSNKLQHTTKNKQTLDII